MSAGPGESAPSFRLPRGLTPLGYRDFAYYWVGIATTNTGRWVELTGLVWLVYELTGSPFLVGLLGAARAAPAFLLSPVAGVIADRVDQRTLMMVTQGLGIFGSLVLAILIVTGAVELWHVYLQVLVQTSINSFDASARQALYPRLVPRSVLPKAVTLNITAARVSKFVGPAAAGFLIADLGEAAPFFVNAASFLPMMVALVLIRQPNPGAARTVVSFRGEIMEGFRHIFSSPVMSGLVKLEVIFGLFEINPAIIAIIGREILDLGARDLGMLLAAPAFGSFVGIGWLLYVKRMGRQGRLSICCTFLYACILAIIALSPSFVVAFVALASIGVFEVLVTVTRSTIMQLAAPPHMRGRVMANMGMITRGAGPLSETQSGFLASVFGPQVALLTAATAIGLAAASTGIFNRGLWHFTLDETQAPDQG